MFESDASSPGRPNDSAFYQQRLPAWKPVVNIHTTMPVFGVLGIILVPFGVLLLCTAGAVKEMRFDYSECGGCENSHFNQPCTCAIDFSLEGKYGGSTIMMYYGLERFYQNHRKYATSRSDAQLQGDPTAVDGSCAPYETHPETGKPYAPCGIIANSMFNDTFELTWVSETQKDGGNVPVNKKINLTMEGIAWDSDHGTKFKNPAGADLTVAFNGTVKPPSWSVEPYNLDPDNPSNNAFLFEPFIVWMRVAAFPTFRKLYSRIEMTLNPELDGGLEKGQYRLTVQYNYPVLFYQSKKFFVLSTTSIFGGRNMMIGIIYLVIGSLLMLLAAAFALIAKKDVHSFLRQ